jgi:hypothetical protein
VTGNVSLSVDGNPQPAQALSSGSAVFTISGLSAGPHNLGATYAAQGNFAASSATGTLIVNKANASVTPATAGKTYGTADPALTGTLSGFVPADNVTATYSRTAGETVAGGPYSISATLSPASVLGNYNITYNTASFTINQANASVTPNPAGKTYGTADPTITGMLSGFLAADTVNASYSRTAGETVAGSPYTISATLSPASVLGNYNITYNTANFTITPAPLTITANSKSKVFGAPLPTLDVAYNGFVSGEGAGGLAGTLACTTTALVLSPVSGNPYSINCSGQTSTNYTFAYVPGTLTVTQATTSVVVTSSTNPSLLNQSVTFTATVSPQFTGTPSGMVMFKDGALTLGTGTLSGGAATFSTSALAAGMHSIMVVYGGDGNFAGSASVALTQTVTYQTSGVCDGDLGHAILRPMNLEGTSVFKQGSTVPAKFRVCDAGGASVGAAGVVASFNLVRVVNGTIVQTVDEPVDSTTPDPAFRWDATGQQWIFNIATKPLPANQTYVFLITLNDGSTISFQYGLK